MNGRAVRRSHGLEGGRGPDVAEYAVYSDAFASRNRYCP